MQLFSADELADLSPEQFNQVLASIGSGARFKVFAWGVSDPHGERPDTGFYLTEPGEWLLSQRLWYSLIASIVPVLFFWNGGVVYIASYLYINMTGGHDVTDDVVNRVRRRLRTVAEDKTTHDFLGQLSDRPLP